MGALYEAVIYAENGKAVNMRSRASLQASVIIKLSVGTKVEVTEEADDEWVGVHYGSLDGYVMRKFVKKVEDNDGGEDTVTLTLPRNIVEQLVKVLNNALGA